ncbi:MAG: hypothetical protein MUC88_00125 [Planctomycetes bacterium]|jgi:hypothetical protein|nr:hypothetical protein [Planctomycetota bacterium]
MASTYRVKHSIAILATLDSDEKLVGFERAEKTTIQTIRTDLEVGKSDTRVIPKSTTDADLDLGGVGTANLLYMETDQELTLKLNGGTEQFKLTPTSGAKAKLFWEGEITEIKASNASTTEDAIVTYLVAGVP